LQSYPALTEGELPTPDGAEAQFLFEAAERPRPPPLVEKEPTTEAGYAQTIAALEKEIKTTRDKIRKLQSKIAPQVARIEKYEKARDLIRSKRAAGQRSAEVRAQKHAAEVIDAFHELRGERGCIGQIAERTGRHRTTISRILKAAELKEPSRRSLGGKSARRNTRRSTNAA
jgi:predicted RNase H-like nuclease (RuvC/YqgF family)